MPGYTERSDILSGGAIIKQTWLYAVNSMSNSEFDIIFRGDIVFGHQLAEVKLKLQQLFKTDAAKIDALFTGRPMPLKRNLDETTAKKYREALLKAGAMVDICPSDNSPANTPAKSPVVPRAPRAISSGWSLAPVGSYLLPADQRPAVPAALQVDISNLSLRPAEGNLVDSVEVPHEIAAAVIVPDLGLAAVGTDLLGEDEKQELPLITIEPGNWGIAEPGSDLLTQAERPVVIPVVIANSDFGLAPAGSDLGQIKPSVKPLTPDISKLRLAE